MCAALLETFPYLEPQAVDRPDDFIPVYEPCLGEREEAYVMDAIRSGWISSLGEYVNRFETEFAAFCQAKEGVSTSNGTTALHLALEALRIGPGDEVIVPALSFVATANAVQYTGATPIFADVDRATWSIDPTEIERLISPQTKAIMPVHLYGHPAPMSAINDLAQQHGLWVIEDAAEGHGAAIEGVRTGRLGHIAAFSFFANKVITTGEGGMLTTDDPALAERCRLLRDHAMRPQRRYWHEEVGFNYRMTNLQAAVGAAQLERIGEFIQRKREIATLYNEGLAGMAGVSLPVELPGYTNIYWMYSVLIEDAYPLDRDALILALRDCGIDSRPFFHPLDTLPPYRQANSKADPSRVACPIASELSQRGLNLPSAPSLTNAQVAYICDILWKVKNKK